MTLLDSRRSQRAAARPARLGALIVGSVVLVGIYVVMSAFARPDGQPVNYNFSTEGASVNLFSSLLMLAAGGVALTTGWALRVEGGRTRLLWIVLALGMAYLAADEVLGFHEWFGDFMDAHGVSAGPFRNWNDILVITYGLVALPVAYLCLPELRRYPRMIPLIGVAAFFYVATTVVDSLMSTTFSTILEETLKLYCSTFLVLSMRAGLAAAHWLRATGRTR